MRLCRPSFSDNRRKGVALNVAGSHLREQTRVSSMVIYEFVGALFRDALSNLGRANLPGNCRHSLLFSQTSKTSAPKKDLALVGTARVRRTVNPKYGLEPVRMLLAPTTSLPQSEESLSLLFPERTSTPRQSSKHRPT